MAAGFDFRRRLGAGHFGEVWYAIDTGLNVECAVKIIPAARVLDQKNFFREAQILHAAQHQNVVEIREAGWLDQDRIYLSMELLRKGSLEDEARGAYVPLTRAKRLMVDVLRGLEHAHNQGILHRDIKPGNILIGDNNEGCLSDFGLAMPIGVDLKKLGVRDYAYIVHRAPEVTAGDPFDVTADVYACGVTLYRLVNGDAAIHGVDVNEMQDLAAEGKFPDRSRYRLFVPRPFRTIINKAINPDPGRRYQSAEEMRRALERCTIEMNWDEQQLTNGHRWSCGWNGRCYEVVLAQVPEGTWSVATRIGLSKAALRRRTRLCADGMSRSEAERFASRILQDCVLGRE